MSNKDIKKKIINVKEFNKIPVYISYNRTNGFSNFNLNKNYNNISSNALHVIKELNKNIINDKDNQIIGVFEYFCIYDSTWMNREYTSWILIIKFKNNNHKNNNHQVNYKIYTNETIDASSHSLPFEELKNNYILVNDEDVIKNYIQYYKF